MLTIAAERVRAKFGYYCSAAMDQLAEIETRAADYERGRRPSPSSASSCRARAASVAVIGGGQAGLAMSYCLKQRGIDHFVFEKHRVGHEWRERRWDSFCLVTPNWQCQLPGFPYPGSEPFGFMKKDEIVRYLEAYAASFGPPIFEGVDRHRAAPPRRRRLRARHDPRAPASPTRSSSPWAATTSPSIPRIAERLPGRTSSSSTRREYRNAGVAARGRRPGRRDRAVGLPDRRGPAPRRAARAPLRRQRAAHGATVPRQGRRRVARRDGLLPHAGRTSTPSRSACAPRPITT